MVPKILTPELMLEYAASTWYQSETFLSDLGSSSMTLKWKDSQYTEKHDHKYGYLVNPHSSDFLQVCESSISATKVKTAVIFPTQCF